MRALVSCLILALMLSGSLTASEMPMMVKVENFDKQAAPVKAALTEYRALTTWSGTFRVETTFTKPMLNWLRADSPSGNLPTGGAYLATISVNMDKAVIQLDLLDKDSKIIQTITGDETSLRDILDQTNKLVYLTEVGESWSYYGGTSPKDPNQEIYVRFSAFGWSSFQLDKAKGYLPTRIERGDYSTDIPPDCVVFSDYRKVGDRWMAWKMVETILVPDLTVVGKTTTITVEAFHVGTPKVVEPNSSVK